MKKNIKRLVAFLLALTLTMSDFSGLGSVYADDVSGTENYEDTASEETVSEEAVPDEAEHFTEERNDATEEYTCGDYTYTLDNDGNATLTKYNGTETVIVTPVTVDDNPVTVLGEYLFSRSSVKTTLTKVTVSEGVLTIGHDCFYYCTAITEILLPTTLVSIDKYAFQDCKSVSTITIPKSVTSMGKEIFDGFVGEVIFESGTTKICDNALYESGVRSVVIPDTVTSIGDYAFYNSASLSEIVIPSGVESIGKYAFYGCDGIQSVIIPDSVKTLGAYCFYSCDELTDITLSKKITSIPESCFSRLSKLKKIVLHEGITSLGYNCFYNDKVLEEINLPSTLTTIEGCALQDCKSISSITIPKSVTSMGKEIFDGFVGEVVFEEGTWAICKYALYNSGAKSVVIPETVTSISDYAFYNSASLSEIVIPSGVESIGKYAFYGCESIQSVIIPDSVTSLGEYCFSYCKELTDITLSKKLTSIPESCFSHLIKLKKLVLHEGITSLGNTCFYNDTALEEINLPSSLKKLGSSCFYDSNFSSIELNEGLEEIGEKCFYKIKVDEVFIPKTVKTIGQYAFAAGKVVFEDGTESISKDAFNDNQYIKEVVIPQSVTTIGDYAFYKSYLESVEIGDNTTVGKYAFSYSRIKKLVLGDNITLEEGCFNNCSKLVKIIARGSVKRKGQRTFAGIPDYVATMGDAEFDYNIQEGILEIEGEGVLQSPDVETAEDEQDPDDLKGLVDDIVICEGITSIGPGELSGFPGIKSLTMPDSVTEIGEGAISGNPKLEKVDFGPNLKKIGKNALQNNATLKEVVFTGKAPSIGGTGEIELAEGGKVYCPISQTNSWTERILGRFGGEIVSWDDTARKKNIVLVLDYSGSMSGSDSTLEEAACAFVDGLGGRLRRTDIAVVRFSDEAQVTCDFSFNMSYLQYSICSMAEPEGGTHYVNALNAAAGLLDEVDTDVPAIIMFSDGEPQDSKVSIRERADEIRNQGYQIYTVGIGLGKQELIDVAGDESRYYEADEMDDLIRVFMEMIEDIEESSETVVKMLRHGTMRDLSKTEAFCSTTTEKVSVFITPKEDKEHEFNYAVLYVNGKEWRESTIGEFKDVPIGELPVGANLTYKIYDVLDEAYDSGSINVDIRKEFYVNYKTIENGKEVEKKDPFINEKDIVEPDIPVKEGMYFDAWYLVENGVKTDKKIFLDSFIKYRKEFEDDIEIVAEWTDTQLPKSATWGFSNSSSIFVSPNSYSYVISADSKKYNMSSADFEYLMSQRFFTTKVEELFRTALVVEKKETTWHGSCYGMAVSALLSNKGMLSVDMYEPASGGNPSNVNKLYINRSGDSDVSALESMINYYHLSQYVNQTREQSVFQIYDDFFRTLDELREPAIFNIYVETGYEGGGGHSVIIYDVAKQAQESVDGKQADKQYKASIYDPNYPNERFVIECTQTEFRSIINFDVKNDNGVSWKDYYRYIELDYIETVSEYLSRISLLNSPESFETVNRDDGQIEEEFLVETDYSRFEISNAGKRSTVDVSGCEALVEGDIPVALHSIGELGSNAREYSLEPISSGSYVITPCGEVNGGNISAYYYSDNGFYMSLDAEKKTSLTVNYNGTAQSHSADINKQSLSVVTNADCPWLLVDVTGETTGFRVVPGADGVEIYSETETVVDIKAQGTVNKVVHEGISLGSAGLIIKAGSNGECIVAKSDGTEISKKDYGYYVIFDTNGGSAVPDVLNVPLGTLVEEPEDPVRAGFNFEGWFKDETFEEEWDFSHDTVAGDTIIYAGWTQKSNAYVTVSFATPGEENVVRTFIRDEYLSIDDCPSIVGYDKNWYEDPEYTIVWDFENNALTDDLTLYSRGDTVARVDFYVEKGDEEAYYTEYATKGKLLEAPEDPSGEGRLFWYWADESGKAWGFSSDRVEEDICLYAAWIEQEKTKDDEETGIYVYLPDYGNYFYTGAAITPDVIVMDGDKVLTKGTDYKVTYKNNKAVGGPSLKASKQPYVTIQGVGNYKSSKKFTRYFEIKPRNMLDAEVTVPDYVVAKKKNAKQTIKPVVKVEGNTIKASEYTVRYFTDENLTEEVKGVTAPGTYYVVVEAKKSKAGEYSGNLYGLSEAQELNVVATKPVDTRKSLDKKKFKLTYGSKDAKAVTGATYTGSVLIPSIYTDAYNPGTDYTVTYKCGKNAVDANKIINAGSYTAVITGTGEYKGTVSISFKINKADLKKLLTERSITVSSIYSQTLSPAGTKPSVTIKYKGNTLVAGTDFSVTYKDNKKVSTDKKRAFATVTGKGNFTGTIKGDGKTSGTTKSGVTRNLNFVISKRSISSTGVEVKVTSVGKPNSKKPKDYSYVKYDIYVDGVKIAKNETKITSISGSTTYTVYILASGINYSGSTTVKTAAALIKISDSKKVKIGKVTEKQYFDGTQHKPVITVTDAEGNDISANFTITYGDNTKAGTGKITVTGKPDKGYVGSKTVSFTILPAWAKWIFK